MQDSSSLLEWVRAAVGQSPEAGPLGPLGQLLGMQARLEHVRYKPGHSLVARVVPFDVDAPRWLGIFGPGAAAKVAKMRRHAQKTGIPLTDVELDGFTLLSGPVGADLRLRRQVRAVRRVVDAEGNPRGRVLAYNPWKRLVQIIDSPRVDGHTDVEGPSVVKISGTAEPDPGHLLAALAEQGVPLVAPLATPAPGISIYPVIPGGDLGRMLKGTSAVSAAETAPVSAAKGRKLLKDTGRALASLHASDLGPVAGLKRVDPVKRLSAARTGVEVLVPGCAKAFDRAADAVLSALGDDVDADDADAQGVVVIHGDFSADQVLVDDRVLLNDFDRVGIGAPGFDLGSFAAVELLAGRHETTDVLVGAYAQAAHQPRQMDAWTALHVLLRCVEPARNLEPDGEAATMRRIDLAWELLAPGSQQSQTRGGAGSSRTPRRCALPLMPDTLTAATHDGEETVRIVRAWPATEGSQLFEGRDEHNRLRAGSLAADGTVDLLPHFTDDRLPELAPRGELLVHRAGRRAVVRTTDVEGGQLYVKHLRRKKVAAIAEATQVAGSLARAAGFSAPEVVARHQHSLTLSTVPGVPVMQLAADLEAWQRAWGSWAKSWPRVVRSEELDASRPDRAVGADVHGPEEEAQVVQTWADHLTNFDPFGWLDSSDGRSLRRKYAAAVSDIADSLRRGKPRMDDAGAWGVAHRDLHDGQMLADPVTGDMGLLDFDTLARAEPALDLGNLIAHLRLREQQGALSREARDIGLAAVELAVEDLRVDRTRLEVYTHASALRLVGVYAFRPQWREYARTLCERLVE